MVNLKKSLQNAAAARVASTMPSRNSMKPVKTHKKNNLKIKKRDLVAAASRALGTSTKVKKGRSGASWATRQGGNKTFTD